MFDPIRHLLSHRLACTVEELAADPPGTSAWSDAREALESTREQEPELAALLDAEDTAALRTLVEGWTSGDRHLPEQDREVLKRALKAFKKRLKITRLDHESTVGGGATSGGRHSSIAGIHPPDQYPEEVWQELAKQGRLLDAGHGVYEMPK